MIFFQKKFLGSDFLAQEKNGSDFLAMLKKFENPCDTDLDMVCIFLIQLLHGDNIFTNTTENFQNMMKPISSILQNKTKGRIFWSGCTFTILEA